MSVNILDNQYDLYFHDPLSYDWTLEAYKYIHNIKTIEDYWKLNILLREYLHLGMFFLMKKDVKPLWNESNNNYSFSIKILKNEALSYWNHFNSHFLSKQILTDKYMNHYDTINGISISPKKNFCIIKIWTTELLDDNIRKVIKIPEKYKGDIIIKKYNDPVSI